MEMRISRMQTRYLIFWLIMATGILTMPLAIAHFTIRDGWISGSLFAVGAAVAAGVCAVYVRAFPKTSLTDALVQVFGSYVGRAIGLWLVIFLCINTGLMARQFLVFAEVSILPRTPPPMIAFGFFLPIAYVTFLGVEVLGRFCEFLTPFAFVVIALIIALAMPDMHFSLLQPILADGWSPVLKSALQPGTSFAFQMVLFLEIIPNLHSRVLSRDVLLVGVFISCVLAIVEIVIICILGGSANYLQYPILEVVRGIQIGRFIQRLDTLYVMGVIAVIVIKVSIYQYLFMTSLKSVFQLKSFQVLILPSTAVTGAATIFLWHDTAELAHYMLFVTPAYFTATLLGLPLLAVAGQFVRQRLMGKKPKGATSSS